MIPIAGAALALVSAFLFYLASPNRKIAMAHAKAALLKSVAWAGLGVSLVLLLLHYGPATAVFVAMTLAMLVLSIAPIAIAWWKGMPEDRT
ncbi:MAG: hypothetical protein IPG54_10795 [Sphingomonadales bacterium]|jgi:hypothetical protein|nr:hypothetical protein [Sphingomonadales bacterium]MBK9004191.1 hypothetical protein [Sphingomonadales bacterium]MBK9269368.1 hypothetical protein [Sphingomonadales bacterium]MBP6434394.1 hypothetical protein [Sphingorhabdus sp.]